MCTNFNTKQTSILLQKNGPTLILTWIPNSSLKKNPKSIESPNRSYATTPSPKRTPRQEYARKKVTTPSPSSSPRGSCVSMGSDAYEQYYMDKGPVKSKKKQSIDNSSMNSEISMGSREDCLDSWSHAEEINRKLSTSNKSQTDSGIDTEDVVQNNEKNIPKKCQTVGRNVNDLHVDKESNSECKTDNRNSTEEDISSSDTTDGLTAEEQLAAMLKRNKLHAKARERLESNKSVSIEMDGDNLVVVTEEIDGPQSSVNMDKYITDKNINKNESKFDTSSSSQSTDAEGISLSSDSTHPSPSGAHYNRMIDELRESVSAQDNGSSTCDSSETITEVTAKPTRTNVPKDLNLNSNASSDAYCSVPSLTTPDISVTRCRHSSSSSMTSGPDSEPPSDGESPPLFPTWNKSPDSPSSEGSVQVSHNLTFPHNSVSYSLGFQERKSAKDQMCGVFSVDLGKIGYSVH